MKFLSIFVVLSLSAGLSYCQGPRDEASPAAWPNWKKVSCLVCTKTIQALDVLLEAKPTKAAAEYAVERVCSYLPDVYANECDQLVVQYGDNLIDLIVKELDSNFLCHAIRVC